MCLNVTIRGLVTSWDLCFVFALKYVLYRKYECSGSSCNNVFAVVEPLGDATFYLALMHDFVRGHSKLRKAWGVVSYFRYAASRTQRVGGWF